MVPNEHPRSSAKRTDRSRSTTHVLWQRFQAKYGIDYRDLSSVVKYVKLRMVTILTKYCGWSLNQLDVVTAFLYGVMEEVVYCAILEGVELGRKHTCVKLVKTIYGLKHASRVCDKAFDEFVCSID